MVFWYIHFYCLVIQIMKTSSNIYEFSFLSHHIKEWKVFLDVLQCDLFRLTRKPWGFKHSCNFWNDNLCSVIWIVSRDQISETSCHLYAVSIPSLASLTITAVLKLNEKHKTSSSGSRTSQRGATPKRATYYQAKFTWKVHQNEENWTENEDAFKICHSQSGFFIKTQWMTLV